MTDSEQKYLDEQRYYQLFELINTDSATLDESEEFTELCTKLFSELLEDNKELFIRLRNI
ncbi:MAG: hypothetical protein WC679_00240 [Bacteroidales bacterium]|jgi:hypothetical protein